MFELIKMNHLEVKQNQRNIT